MTSAIRFAILGSHFSQSYQQQIWRHHRNFSVNELSIPRIYVYIYILSSTDRPVSFYQNPSVWLDMLDSRSWDGKPGWLKRQSKFLPLSHEETSAIEGNLNAYVSHLFLFKYIPLTATEGSIHLKSLALC